MAPPKKRPPLPLGPTIQAKPGACPACDSRRIVKDGLRKNSFRHLQVYWCKDCRAHFSSLAGLKGVKYPPRLIARAVSLYNGGYSQEEVARRIASEHRIAVPRRPITTFHRFRAAAVNEFGHNMLRERTLDHQQVYEYKVHLAKLARMTDAVPANVAAKVKSYLMSIFEDFPDSLFQQESVTDLGPKVADDRPGSTTALRSSKSHFETLPFARAEKQNLANDLAAFGLLLARRNKDRHASVQDFMLANDSCTVACEVPVYIDAAEVRYYRSKGFFVALPESPKPITGHIDIVQARNGFIHLLDYKPNARRINPVNQLLVYALAFASRTRLPLKALKCAWFDEGKGGQGYFEFFPLQAVRAKAAQTPFAS